MYYSDTTLTARLTSVKTLLETGGNAVFGVYDASDVLLGSVTLPTLSVTYVSEHTGTSGGMTTVMGLILTSGGLELGITTSGTIDSVRLRSGGGTEVLRINTIPTIGMTSDSVGGYGNHNGASCFRSIVAVGDILKIGSTNTNVTIFEVR